MDFGTIVYYSSFPWLIVVLFGLLVTITSKEFRLELPTNRLFDQIVLSIFCSLYSIFYMKDRISTRVWVGSTIILFIIIFLAKREKEKHKEKMMMLFR